MWSINIIPVAKVDKLNIKLFSNYQMLKEIGQPCKNALKPGTAYACNNIYGKYVAYGTVINWKAPKVAALGKKIWDKWTENK